MRRPTSRPTVPLSSPFLALDTDKVRYNLGVFATDGMTSIGKRIRELREKRGLSQRDIERATGMAAAYISRVENGYTTPSLDSVQRFSAALAVPLHEMFRDGEPSKAKDPIAEMMAGYLRRMKPTDRESLLKLARSLAKVNASD